MVDSSTKTDLTKLLLQFNILRDHPSYLIREKIYRGVGSESGGLIPTEKLLINIIKEFQKIDAEVIGFHLKSLQEFYNDINEGIDIILSYQKINLSSDEVWKYAIFIQTRVEDLLKYIIGLQVHTKQDIEKIQKITIEDKLERLKHKFEDNIDQILKSFSWKEYETKILALENEDEFIRFTSLLRKFNSAKLIGSQIKDKDYLDVLAKLAGTIRVFVADNFEATAILIPLLETVSKIFEQDEDIHLDNQDLIIPISYLKQTIDNFINTSRINWLALFFESIMEDTPDDMLLLRTFAIRFYQITSDPKEYFLWTMSYYSRMQDDMELTHLSFKVANLTGILLTVVDKLQKLQQDTLVHSIINLDNISFEDAILDLSEIYEKKKDWAHLMKQALKSKLNQLKQLLQEATQFDEAVEEIIFMFQNEIHEEHELYPIKPEKLRFIIENY